VGSVRLPALAATGAALGGLTSTTSAATVRLTSPPSGADTGPVTGRTGATPTGRRVAVRCFCFLVFLAMFSREA
jgi:hypothetical protein